MAAPGYDEIAPASNAYFQYVNAHGGIYGRKIVYKYLDDKYDPTNTVSVVKQLVLQDNVYAIFDGLGTPTHLAVAPYLNSSKVPDVFVASGCECWNAPSTLPETFGWQLDYVREGKILGTYIKKHFAGQKIGYFFQDDEFGKDGVKGLDDEIPHADVVSRQSYDPTNINVGPQVAALKASGAKVVVSFSVPAFTALLKLNSLKLGFNPTFVVSDVGSDPITLAGLLEAYAKQGGATVSGNQLTQGIITDGYLPTLGDTSNSWVALFKKIHDTVPAQAALRRQRGVRRGGRVHLRPGHAQGGQEPDPGRPGQGDPGRAAARASRGAVHLLRIGSRRDDRGLHRHHQERRDRQAGPGPGHGHVPDRGGDQLQRDAGPGTVQRDALAYARAPGTAGPGHGSRTGVAGVGVATSRRLPDDRGQPPAQRLLAAAERLFGERSYQRTTVADICARAGMATGSFYAHFSSKAEIFAAVVRQLNADLRTAMREAIEQAGPGHREIERASFRAFFDMLSQRPWMDRIVRESEFVAPGLFREYYEHLARGYARGVRQAQLSGEVDAHYDPEVIAFMYTGIGNFVGMRWADWTAGGQVPDDVLDDLLEVLRRGLPPARPPQ